MARGLPLTLEKSTDIRPRANPRESAKTMNRWNDASETHRPGSARSCQGSDRWVERTRSYLLSRTADHWLMFAGGLLLGALLG